MSNHSNAVELNGSIKVDEVIDTRTDEERIKDGEWVDCFVCAQMLYIKRETSAYCIHCHRGFCMDKHGTFAKKGGFGVCVDCFKFKD